MIGGNNTPPDGPAKRLWTIVRNIAESVYIFYFRNIAYFFSDQRTFGGNYNSVVYLQEAAAPGTPSAGWLAEYATTSSLPQAKNDDGVVIPMQYSQLNFDADRGNPSASVTRAMEIYTPVTHHPGATLTYLAFGAVRLPPGWAGKTVNVRVLWSKDDAASGNVRLRWYVTRLVNGGADHGNPVTITNAVTVAVPASINITSEWSFSMSLSAYSEGDYMGSLFYRDGAHAADTYTGQVNYIAATVSLT